MKRIVGTAFALALAAFLVLVPVATAADPATDEGRVVVSVRGDVTLPADDRADAVVVVDGVATIAGDVRSLVVVEGSAVVEGAQIGTLWAIRSDVELGPGTVVTGDVRTLDAPVHMVGDAVVQGEVSDIQASLFAIGAVLAPAVLLFWLGTGLATIIAGLLLAGLASRQVRMAEQVITREPALAFLAGLLGIVVFPVAAVLLMVTIVGAPLGLGVLFGLWPLLAYVGYLVAGIWIGDWLLTRSETSRERERPYLAATIGLVLLLLTGLVPVVGMVTAIASLLGFGGVLVVAWRVLTSVRPGTQQVAAPAPLAG